ncbi:MAG: alpha/beta fold hydrolase [Pseudonocardia sp.]|nr:alpha/beta fold hydrolase [Pseudonocardia sp.]
MDDADFASQTASVNGTTLHHVRGGAGPTVLLIHGFRQDGYEWRYVMPLARRFSVVAVDLPGVGGSGAPDAGHDAPTMAIDVAELVDGLGVGPVHVVGHDVGGWVAYALGRLGPDLARSI